jgi:hypothetical protein
MNALTDAMIAVQKQGSAGIIKGSTADFKLSIRQVLAEGDLVAVYTTLSSTNTSEGGLRQLHLFRFKAIIAKFPLANAICVSNKLDSIKIL